jgi:hypothetical protein
VNRLGNRNRERTIAATQLRYIVESLDCEFRQNQRNVKQRFPVGFVRHSAITDSHRSNCISAKCSLSVLQLEQYWVASRPNAPNTVSCRSVPLTTLPIQRMIQGSQRLVSSDAKDHCQHLDFCDHNRPFSGRVLSVCAPMLRTSGSKSYLRCIVLWLQ